MASKLSEQVPAKACLSRRRMSVSPANAVHQIENIPRPTALSTMSWRTSGVSFAARSTTHLCARSQTSLRRNHRRSESVGSRPIFPGNLSRPVRAIVAVAFARSVDDSVGSACTTPPQHRQALAGCCRDRANSSSLAPHASFLYTNCSERTRTGSSSRPSKVAVAAPWTASARPPSVFRSVARSNCSSRQEQPEGRLRHPDRQCISEAPAPC